MLPSEDPIQIEYLQKMNDLARFLDQEFNGEVKDKSDRKVGFLLLVTEFGDGKPANYISNVERPSAVEMLKELLDRWGGLPKFGNIAGQWPSSQ